MHEQKIYFGAPGTGKSFFIKEKLKGVKDDKIFRVTVHPEYMYSDFVGQILPVSLPGGGTGFEFNEGPFTQALMEAYSNLTEDVYLVVEELSRGNVAAIFGDIFQLLDRDSHFESRYSIRNENIYSKIPTLVTNEIKLPSNFNILCTVNMNDQNVFPMDTAFKRRFDWEYVSTCPVLDTTGKVDKKKNNAKIKVAVDSVRTNDLETTWQSFYMALNSFITDKEKGLGKKEDKQVGQFFIEFDDSVIADSHSSVSAIADKAQEDINKKIKNKLLIYLWQDVQGVSTFKGATSLFASNMSSYDMLYNTYGNDKVFSDAFLDDFLKPMIAKYPY